MNYRINVFEVNNEESNVKAYANVAFGEYKMSRLNVQKILYKNVQLICRF